MKVELFSTRSLLGMGAGTWLILAAWGCQNTAPVVAPEAVVPTPRAKIPGPHNVFIVDSNLAGGWNPTDWPCLSPSLILYVPATDDAYPRDSSGKLYKELEYTVPEASTVGPRIPGPHNTVFITMTRSFAEPRAGAKPLTAMPQVYIHLKSKGHPRDEVYAPRSTPFVIINLPENFEQALPGHPAVEHTIRPHP